MTSQCQYCESTCHFIPLTARAVLVLRKHPCSSERREDPCLKDTEDELCIVSQVVGRLTADQEVAGLNPHSCESVFKMNTLYSLYIIYPL